MANAPRGLSRRAFLTAASATALAFLAPAPARAAEPRLAKPIPSTGETVPAIGMGTWITFNVGDDAAARAGRADVLRAFFGAGGGMIDSSPMYGTAEAVLGDTLGRLDGSPGLFAATKVWTAGESRGRAQMAESERLWGGRTFDLMQVHNLVDWRTHLRTLTAWKAEGRVRYVGVTTSHGRRHDDLARILETEPVDFVQLTYNAVDRAAERRLLPLAAERGIAVIANRPFRRGALVDRCQRHPLPDWAAEVDAATWPALLLKFIVAHPAVTCAIPATSRVPHMLENMAAGLGRQPDAAMRRRIAEHVASL